MNRKIYPLMPKATAVWLIDNTKLTFKQIADFCGIHELEIQNIANGESALSVVASDPILAGQISRDKLTKCENDPSLMLELNDSYVSALTSIKPNKKKYTPLARRHEKPDAIYWLIKNYPDVKDSQIAKLLGTTKNTITTIRTHSHWNMKNLRPRDPVILGLCTQTELNKLIEKISA